MCQAGDTKLLQHSGVKQFSGGLFSKVRNQADKTQRNSGRGAESTKPQNQGNEGGRSKQEESLRQEMLVHCSLYKRPDKLATREKKAWPVNTTGRGTKGTQVRHVT